LKRANIVNFAVFRQKSPKFCEKLELCDLAETQFEQAKNQVEIVVEKYTKWSAKKTRPSKSSAAKLHKADDAREAA